MYCTRTKTSQEVELEDTPLG